MRRQGYLWYGSDVGGRMGLLVLAGIVLEQTTVMALTLACALLALSQLRGTTGCTVDSQIFYPGERHGEPPVESVTSPSYIATNSDK